jgi:hypothetical protein
MCGMIGSTGGTGDARFSEAPEFTSTFCSIFSISFLCGVLWITVLIDHCIVLSSMWSFWFALMYLKMLLRCYIIRWAILNSYLAAQRANIVVCPIVVSHLAIVLSFLLRFMASNYLFGIFKLFLKELSCSLPPDTRSRKVHIIVTSDETECILIARLKESMFERDRILCITTRSQRQIITNLLIMIRSKSSYIYNERAKGVLCIWLVWHNLHTPVPFLFVPRNNIISIYQHGKQQEKRGVVKPLNDSWDIIKIWKQNRLKGANYGTLTSPNIWLRKSNSVMGIFVLTKTSFFNNSIMATFNQEMSLFENF